jgi:glycosyltransferase involved in cell wall biosynthesis
MLVGVVGTHGLPASYSGWETLVHNLFYRRVKVEYLIATPKSRIQEQSPLEKSVSLYIPLKASGWQSLFYDALSMWRMRNKVDVILILGISGCWFLPFFNLFFNGQIITNTDGIEHKREKWGLVASMILKISENLAVKFSNKLIADNPGIDNYLLKTYSRKADAIIAYGGIEYEVNKSLYLEKYPVEPKSFDLAIARIVPENNIETILEAYQGESRNLLFVGNWDTSSYSVELFNRDWSSNICLLPADYNQHRLSSLRKACRFYIHGHSAGGTNPSLVEALSLGCNILSYNVNFNRYVIEDYGSYWTDTEGLKSLVEQDFNRKSETSILEYYNANYKWEVIINLYEMILC